MTITTTLGINLQKTVSDCTALRERGDENWYGLHTSLSHKHSNGLNRWRRLEAALAAVGSQSETVMDTIQEEQESGRAKPIDIDGLLAGVVPSLLGLSREHILV